MIGFVLSAIVLSCIGAIAQRGLAALLGVRARLVLGVGPRPGSADRTLGAIELRPIPLWIWTAFVSAREPLDRAVAVIAIGPVAMLLVPFVVLVAAIAARGADDPDPGPPLVVGTVEDGSPADAAGIEPGDVVVSVEDVATPDLRSLIAVVRPRGGQPTRVIIERDGARRELSVTPIALEDRAVIGMFAQPGRRAVGIGESIELAGGSVAGLWRRLLSSDHDPQDEPTGGPVVLRPPPAGTELDAATRLAVIALAWTVVAPLWALFMTIGGAIAIARRGA